MKIKIGDILLPSEYLLANKTNISGFILEVKEDKVIAILNNGIVQHLRLDTVKDLFKICDMNDIT